MALRQLERVQPIVQVNEQGQEIVTASDNDPKGFSTYYQQNLNARIIAQRLAKVLGPIPTEDVIPKSSTTMMLGPTRPRGVVQTQIAPNLITTNDKSNRKREEQQR